MKVTSTIPSPFFFYPGTSSRRSFARQNTVRVKNPAPKFETDDDLGRKQEIICGVILALCLVSTVVMCFLQLTLA